MSATNPKFTAAALVRGQIYHVVFAFVDYDGTVHPAGESWRFLEKHFLPYEDGLTLIVEKNGKNDSIRLQWREEAQAEIIENFSDYVTV